MDMKTYTQDGVLVLADISGFTEFVTATELEHGPQIIAALLEAVMGRLAPPLEIQEVEGDAIFAVGPDGVVVPPARLLDVLDGAFVAFKDRQREMEADDSCAVAPAGTSRIWISRSSPTMVASSDSWSAAAARWPASTSSSRIGC
mgnify:CR=1 FL=1